MFGLKQYGKAINIYQDILNVEKEGKINEEFIGHVWYNLGAAYARVFRFDLALEALEQAYEFLKDQSVVEKIFHLTKLDPGIKIHEKYLLLISEEEEAAWAEKFENARELAEHTEELEKLRELFGKDSIRRMEGAAAMVKEWKQEYRSMA